MLALRKVSADLGACPGDGVDDPGRSGLVQVTTNSWGCDMIGTVVGVAVLGVVSRELDYSVFVMFFFGASEVSTISTILKTKCR